MKKSSNLLSVTGATTSYEPEPISWSVSHKHLTYNEEIYNEEIIKGTM